jgi:hypothetical protein
MAAPYKRKQRSANQAAADYAKHSERAATRQADASRAGRDIGEIPKVADPARKERGSKSLEFFLRAYLGKRFYLPWSEDHIKAIDKTQRAILSGIAELFAWAMPRGGGKTSIVVGAALWALLYFPQMFLLLLAATDDLAKNLLSSIKAELETNTVLAADFPEVCYPVSKLDGIANRAQAQLYRKERTRLKWGSDEIIFPSIPGSVCAGTIVRVAGITGAFRGASFTRSDGSTVRPRVVILDDPQTDEVAKGFNQVDKLEAIINGAVLGLAGPNETVTVLMPCTVIAPDDLSDRFLDREKNPIWQGERAKMIYGWPAHEDLWDQYAKIRGDALRAGLDQTEATTFYRANRAAMDDGAAAAWPVRKLPDDLSAIQHAMNLFYKIGRRAFFSEYQNDPIPEDKKDALALTVELTASKANGMPRGLVPLESTRLVAFIDVQKELLFYVVAAVDGAFGGHVCDYGTYPDQKREVFSKSDVRRTLMLAEKANRWEEGVRRGLDAIASLIIGHKWTRDGGGVATIQRSLVDAHWGDSTEIVKNFCRSSVHSSVLTPSYGLGITAGKLPINDKPVKPGERAGLNWRMPIPKPGQVRHITFDANFWKSFAAARLMQAERTSGNWTIWGSPEDHPLLCRHWTSEYPTPTEGRGRKVTEWSLRPDRPDNDWWDGLVGCMVAASMEGAALAEMPNGDPAKPRVRKSQIQAARRQWQAKQGKN